MDGSQTLSHTEQTAKSEPLAGTNAIETAVFAIELAQPQTPDRVEAIKQALDAFAQELPGEHIAQQPNMFVAFGPTLPPFGEALRFVAKPTGDHAWRVQLTGNVLQVICTEYTRFSEVWGRAHKYVQAMLAAADPDCIVTSVSHQYIDKFLYPAGMTLHQYSMAELFSRDTAYLTPQAWNSGLEWHVYQGWFDYANAESRRMLHQLNVTNATLAAPMPRLASVIDHRTSLQYAAAQPPTAGQMAAPDGPLDAHMAELHAAHKAVIAQLLRLEKRQEIGMEI